jgi:hypothetical protein
MHTLKRTYNNLKIIKILTINMASHTHSGASCGINRNHLGYVHKFCILNNDKTALNTSLDNVYCWAKIKIAYKYIYTCTMISRTLKGATTVSSVPTLYPLLFQHSLYGRLNSVSPIKVSPRVTHPSNYVIFKERGVAVHIM